MIVKVCIGSACHIKGSQEVIKEFQRFIKEYNLEDKVSLRGAFCMNKCTDAVSTEIDNEIVSMNPFSVKEFIERKVEENKWNI